MNKIALSLGAFFAGLGIALGAFGAHALKQILSSEQLAVFETGVRYQMYHAFALLLVGIAYGFSPAPYFRRAAACFTVGIVLFSGSLYALTFLKMNGQVGLGGLGLITPIGGVFFILGWLTFLLGVWKHVK